MHRETSDYYHGLLDSIIFATGQVFHIYSNQCVGSINAGSSCTLAVEYTPSQAGVASSDTLQIGYGSPANIQNVQLDGYALQQSLAAMSNPVPGFTLTGSSVTFSWTAGSGATAYWLDVGTVQGQGNISAGQLASSVTSETVNGIPTTGVTVYVRLWTMLNGAWQYHDYTYTAFSLGTLAAMSNPGPGSTFTGASVTFSWTAGSGATAYWLDIGTVQGQGNISAGQLASSVTSETVNGISTTGGTIYVRLWTMLNGAWQYRDYTYMAANLGTLAAMSNPGPGSTFTGASVTFSWTAGSGAAAYWLDVGTVQGQGNISAGQLASSVTSATVNGIPTTGGTIYVRLWTMLNGAWQYHDYTYTAANPGTLAVMSAPAPGSTLTGSSVTFTWTAALGASAYWLDVGTVQGQGNISAGQLAFSVTSETVSGIPTTGGTIYVRLWTMLNGAWQYHDYTYAGATLGALAAMTSPTPGSTLTASSVTFTWSAAADASAYWLDVGTVQGQGNISAGQLATSVTSETVSGIPTNGSAIYVRLWTQISGTWSYHDYTYTAF